MRAVDLIQKKRNGGQLTTEEIQWLIGGYVKGTVPDYQMSAFAMATYFKGMTMAETRDLTMAMVASGDQLDLSAIPGIKVDKHSTGGVGDKVTLLLAPLVASFGVPVAKMSGKGLGHTGGTLDKLESIKGYQIEVAEAAFIKQVQDIGIAVIGQSEQMVKADKLLYALRDVTATVDTMPLIASSVMSKKIAAGSDAIMLDVTVGDGAFMKTVEEAEKLSRTMVDLGKEVGRQTIAVMTNMSQPLGQAIGNRLEVLEAVQIMQGKGRVDIRDFICQLAQIMLKLGGLEVSLDDIEQHLTQGQALKKFEELVAAQGGQVQDIYRPVKTKFVYEVKAEQSGYIAELPALYFGRFAMEIGAGRAVKSDQLDYDAGILFDKKVGDAVSEGELLAKIYSNQEIPQKKITEFAKNVTINNVKVHRKEILKIID
ncbi:pyrimidine-nucleoside phosphorylase [Streptococcus sobrinus]|uniref:pyrimidine-nucleoside phosphorylase n=1 Tax=Streptococcus sobrinus TaxID=1310 RepID=UPI0002EC2466|nr:pyrimidine-nucleoside phosphorylase [Streptococcus sobrinus]